MFLDTNNPPTFAYAFPVLLGPPLPLFLVLLCFDFSFPRPTLFPSNMFGLRSPFGSCLLPLFAFDLSVCCRDPTCPQFWLMPHSSICPTWYCQSLLFILIAAPPPFFFHNPMLPKPSFVHVHSPLNKLNSTPPSILVCCCFFSHLVFIFFVWYGICPNVSPLT